MVVTVSAPHHARSLAPRLLAGAATACVLALGMLYVSRPTLPTVSVPEHVHMLASWTVGRFDITAVLAATAVLAVVTTMRRLPYGLGAILGLGLGANLTNATIGSRFADLPATLAPSGHVAAATALYCSAILVTSPSWRPAVAGLGFAGVVMVGVSTLVADATSLFAIVAGALIALVWGCAAAILMSRSPEAAKREEARPDTAALAFSRHRSIRL